MRSSVLALTLVLASACSGGGSSSSGPPPSPLFGGFQVRDTAAVVFPPTVCDVTVLGTTSISGAAVLFADHDHACEVAKATSLCGARASSTEVLALAVRGAPGIGGVPPVDAGQYVFYPDPPVGAFRAIDGTAARVDATCQAATSADAPDLTGGAINLSSVGADALKGSVSLRFTGNQGFDATFDATVCTTTIDLCALLTCISPTCASTTL
jgi:hypothetical protein